MKSASNRNSRLSIPVVVAAMLLAAASAGPANAEPRTFKIDPDHFSIGFSINHLGYADVLGSFLDASGEFTYDEDTQTLKSAQVVVQSESVFTNQAERDKHVREEDFLDVGEYPRIVFKATDFKATGDSKGKLTGDLSMLGQKHPVTLDVTLNKAATYPITHEEYTLGISATTTIKRSKWGMTYALEPVLVGDEVNLRFEFEAIREVQQPQ